MTKKAGRERDGMISREKWQETSVHAASRYACGKCGQEFESPHDLYDHLDEEHPHGSSGRKR